MPVLAWRPKNERGPDLQIADKGSLHAGETIVCAFALLPSVTTERKANPKAESQLPGQDSVKQIHDMRNPCHIASAQGGFLPFAFGIPEAGSSSIVCGISSANRLLACGF